MDRCADCTFYSRRTLTGSGSDRVKVKVDKNYLIMILLDFPHHTKLVSLARDLNTAQAVVISFSSTQNWVGKQLTKKLGFSVAVREMMRRVHSGMGGTRDAEVKQRRGFVRDVPPWTLAFYLCHRSHHVNCL